jgi:hypothetical protein
MTQLLTIVSVDPAMPDASLFTLPTAIDALVKKAENAGEAKAEQSQ